MPNDASNSHIRLLNLDILNNTVKMEGNHGSLPIQAYKRAYNSLSLNGKHTAYRLKYFHKCTKLLIQNQQHISFRPYHPINCCSQQTPQKANKSQRGGKDQFYFQNIPLILITALLFTKGRKESDIYSKENNNIQKASKNVRLRTFDNRSSSTTVPLHRIPEHWFDFDRW